MFFFSGNVTNFPAVLQPPSTCQWFRLLTVCCQRLTNQPIVFCVVRPTLNSLALAKRAVSLFSSRAAALVSRVSRLRRSRARALLPLNLKKKRDCSQSIHTMQRWEKLLGDPLLARISVSESTSYHMTALALVPDPMLLGTGPNYPPIQQVTENRGFNQIQKFFHRYTPVR